MDTRDKSDKMMTMHQLEVGPPRDSGFNIQQ